MKISELRKSLKIGDRIQVKQRVEAMYSRYPPLHPEQWLEPGVTAIVKSVHCAAVRCNTFTKDEFVRVEFEGVVYGTEKYPYTNWSAQVDYTNLIVVTETEEAKIHATEQEAR